MLDFFIWLGVSSNLFNCHQLVGKVLLLFRIHFAHWMLALFVLHLHHFFNLLHCLRHLEVVDLLLARARSSACCSRSSSSPFAEEMLSPRRISIRPHSERYGKRDLWISQRQQDLLINLMTV